MNPIKNHRDKIEESTIYAIPNGEIVHYETTVPCDNIRFTFPNPVITMMLHGEKVISWEDGNLAFRQQYLYIPQVSTPLNIAINGASSQNPTQCIVLSIDPDFLQQERLEIAENWQLDIQDQQKELLFVPDYYLKRNQLLCGCYANLFLQRQGNHRLMAPKDYLLNLRLKELVYELLRSKANHLLFTDSQALPLNTHTPLKAVIDYIEAHFRDRITVEDFAKTACMSQAQLFRKFREIFDCTPIQYLNHRRLEQARIMLLHLPHIPVKNIAFEVGFNSVEHFSRSFKEKYGYAPSETKPARDSD